MSERKPYNDCVGYIASRRHWLHRGWVVIYRAAEQGIDVGGEKYAIVCETHANIGASRNMPDARVLMKYPENFCEECQSQVAMAEAMNGRAT